MLVMLLIIENLLIQVDYGFKKYIFIRYMNIIMFFRKSVYSIEE